MNSAGRRKRRREDQTPTLKGADYLVGQRKKDFGYADFMHTASTSGWTKRIVHVNKVTSTLCSTVRTIGTGKTLKVFN